jgi:hypothetical protein
MAKKTKTQTAKKKVVRATRKAAKVQRKPIAADGDGMGKLIDSIQKQHERENVKQAAFRIVKEAAERK